MTNKIKREVEVSAYHLGQRVIWNQDRKWGGTQPEPATFIEFRGTQSARIKHGDKERTVSLKRLRPASSR